MSLVHEEDIRKVWGSHIPLLTAVLEILKPNTAVECGCGNYSTPLLASFCKNELTSIEHDCKWGKRMKKEFPEVHFILDEIPLCERRFLKKGQLEDIELLYKNYAAGFSPFDLLFVDTVACGRVPAFNALKHRAKWIVVHDTDPQSHLHYNYDLLDTKGMFHYLLKPDGNVNGHKLEWTSLYTHKKLVDLALLEKVVNRESLKLWGFPATFIQVQK